MEQTRKQGQRGPDHIQRKIRTPKSTKPENERSKTYPVQLTPDQNAAIIATYGSRSKAIKSLLPYCTLPKWVKKVATILIIGTCLTSCFHVHNDLFDIVQRDGQPIPHTCIDTTHKVCDGNCECDGMECIINPKTKQP